VSGTAQGIPQRLTAFVDPRTGLVSDTWWRFLQTLWQRTGGAQATSTTDDIINWQNLADVPPAIPAEGAAWLSVLMSDAAPPPPAAFVDIMQNAPPAVGAEIAAWLAFLMADPPPPPPEQNPALVALMVT